ncbi:uncharacterized protein E5676_scaffold1737G00110 [Cucumis melo var. makuwa]|uniref:Uncharacterized protein n=1 Tax=Cucumis melo var. makuwa TaxID=1194695 RepID=A0A5A7UAR1_CUCMM|nr:uncharacterized protein E6C27_scaffold673G001830 [Cucumis melo var. makuwa]TYK07742.1 uncharacterized protein E5676_scaffold1737G00110 [Cucumis melo var. makuwa]
MLDIRDMLEKDKVFCFVEGLKPWARAKLHKQRVQDLTSTYAAAERLFDLTSDSQEVRRHQSSSPGRNRNSRPSSPKAGGGDECPDKDRRSHQSNTENTWRRPNNRSPPKRPLSCFICEKSHLARECLNKVNFHAFQASLIADSDDKSNQAEDEDEVGQIDGGEKTRIGAIKYLSSLQKKSGERNVLVEMGLLYVDTWINQKQTKSTMIDSGATHNFIIEAEARRLRLRSEKDSRRMKALNSVALPIVGLVKRTTIKLGGWKGPVDFVVVKMDDFDVVLGMEFLLEHKVIPTPSAKCLAITGSFPTLAQIHVDAKNDRPWNRIVVRGKSVCEECVSHGIVGVSQTLETIKDVVEYGISLAKLWKPSKMLLNTGFRRLVQALYGVHVLPLKKKDRTPQQRIDCRIQSKLTVRHKYSLPMLTRWVDRPRGVKYLPKSDIRSRYCRVRTTKAKGLETTCVTGHEAYEFPIVPLSLTDATGGKCCSVQSQINVLGHVGECHQSGLLREEDTQWSGNLECQASFNGLKQAMIEGPSLRVIDATKTPKVKAEPFNCVLEEYVYHYVDGRQKNLVQLLKVTQYGHRAQTNSLIKRSPFEIKGKRHSVFPPLADVPYVGNRP